ncbi:MAG: MarR family transcriptional regulator [Spirochaetales bacterium]|nr:MarR family transcriptional regulator [Spirochaetales bacterium]
MLVDISSFDNDILVAIRQIVSKIDIQSRLLNKRYGLTGPQLIVLREIQKFPGITSAKLSSNINLTQSTVTKILDRLEIKNFVQRRKSSVDKRKIELYNSPDVAELLSKNPSVFQDDFLKKLNSLEDWERHQLLSSLQRIASMMGADSCEVAPVLFNPALDK